MTIRHRVDKNRKVEDVTKDDRRSGYVVLGRDMLTIYPFASWEPADIEEWQLILTVLGRDGTALRDVDTHVAGILNSNYRFVEGTQVEKRIV